ncbi:hypothetical protein DUI87_14666 [Hirundo rustica rustica]|uniref:Netrin module non-TIMP type domain-containing protein n=1 Tax=Hirundo rustica rustica TaxID=333673 RepID=A0A3M0K5F6_HIRRU|nr:hypothetical protein DUI87_14666 [Hirundo rustica rustica]
MYLSRFLSLHALWVTVSSVMQHYPSVWGHYDVCKTQIYTEEGKVWDYMACQPEARDMIKYVKVTLDPPDITCGDPPETFCAMVNTDLEKSRVFSAIPIISKSTKQPSLLLQDDKEVEAASCSILMSVP